MTSTAAPTFLVTSGFWKTLPQMPLEQYPGTEGFIDDVYANPNGVPMCSGYFELRNPDAPLDYYYDYDEMKIVLEGEFRLENVDTGQVEIARAKDAIFFPKGSRILFRFWAAFWTVPGRAHVLQIQQIAYPTHVREVLRAQIRLGALEDLPTNAFKEGVVVLALRDGKRVQGIGAILRFKLRHSTSSGVRE